MLSRSLMVEVRRSFFEHTENLSEEAVLECEGADAGLKVGIGDVEEDAMDEEEVADEEVPRDEKLLRCGELLRERVRMTEPTAEAREPIRLW